MEPVKLIIAALTAGAAGGTENAASTALGDAYQRLKRLVAARFTGDKAAEAALTEHEVNPEAWRAPLEKALRNTGADTDPGVIDAAQRLMELLGNAGSTISKYMVTRDRGKARPVAPGGPVCLPARSRALQKSVRPRWVGPCLPARSRALQKSVRPRWVGPCLPARSRALQKSVRPRWVGPCLHARSRAWQKPAGCGLLLRKPAFQIE